MFNLIGWLFGLFMIVGFVWNYREEDFQGRLSLWFFLGLYLFGLIVMPVTFIFYYIIDLTFVVNDWTTAVNNVVHITKFGGTLQGISEHQSFLAGFFTAFIFFWGALSGLTVLYGLLSLLGFKFHE